MEKRYSLTIFSSYDSQGGFECTSTISVCSVLLRMKVKLFMRHAVSGRLSRLLFKQAKSGVKSSILYQT